MANSTTPKFVIVSWLDAWGAETSEATVSTAHEQHKPVPMETAGWLLFENEVGVSVFCERCMEGKEIVYRGKTFIPKGMIVGVQEYNLTKPRKKKQDVGTTSHDPVVAPAGTPDQGT